MSKKGLILASAHPSWRALHSCSTRIVHRGTTYLWTPSTHARNQGDQPLLLSLGAAAQVQWPGAPGAASLQHPALTAPWAQQIPLRDQLQLQLLVLLTPPPRLTPTPQLPQMQQNSQPSSSTRTLPLLRPLQRHPQMQYQHSKSSSSRSLQHSPGGAGAGPPHVIMTHQRPQKQHWQQYQRLRHSPLQPQHSRSSRSLQPPPGGAGARHPQVTVTQPQREHPHPPGALSPPPESKPYWSGKLLSQQPSRQMLPLLLHASRLLLQLLLLVTAQRLCQSGPGPLHLTGR